MRVGFLLGHSTTPKNRIRGSDLFPVLRTFGLDVDECSPFEEYNFVVCKESHVDGVARYRTAGSKIILDWSDVIYNENQSHLLKFAKDSDKVVVGTQAHQDYLEKHKIRSILIPDGVAYQIPTPVRKELKNLIWYGCHDETLGGMTDLLALNSFFREISGCHLTIVSNNVDAYVEVAKSLEIPTTYVPYDPKSFHDVLTRNDVVIIPYPNSSFVNYKSSNRLLEAMVSGVPVICGASAQNNRMFKSVKDRVKKDVDFYYTVNDPMEYLDMFDFMRSDIAITQHFCDVARGYVLQNELIQNRGYSWAEIFR